MPLRGNRIGLAEDRSCRFTKGILQMRLSHTRPVAAAADSIDDMSLLRHAAMRRLFDQPYAPSTLGSFLRAFAFGHVRQLDAVASRFLTELAAVSPVTAGVEELAIL